MTTKPQPAPWRSCEIDVADPEADPNWCVPAESQRQARAQALDARMDGSALVTLIQRWDGERYVTIETCFARGWKRVYEAQKKAKTK